MRVAVNRLHPIVLLLITLAGCVASRKPVETQPAVPYQAVAWSELDGWADDSTHEAWGAFLLTCKARAARPEWSAVCAAAKTEAASDPAAARRFFEAQFTPYRLQKSPQEQGPREVGLITAYYEPLLFGSRVPAPTFLHPLYTVPDDLLTIDLTSVYPELKGKRLRGRLQGNKVIPYYSRAELDNSPLLNGKELVWVTNALDAFNLQIQGSGRVQLTDGVTIRLAYADQNGHPYRSIGRYLVDNGELTVAEATAPGIRGWLEAHPERTREVLDSNPSMVFFREEPIADPSEGPKGALAVPLTPGRSIAVDPAWIPLGAPVFLSTTYPATDVPLRRLTMAQDTGGAIRGIVRADLFWGFGAGAGESAGRMRQDGRMWLLWPKNQPLPAEMPERGR
jgi:membrane-bound lytic murein transglycosylase A